MVKDVEFKSYVSVVLLIYFRVIFYNLSVYLLIVKCSAFRFTIGLLVNVL